MWDRIGCPETSVNNYHSTLRVIPEQRRSRLYHGGNLKPPIWINLTIPCKFSVYYFFSVCGQKGKELWKFNDLKYESKKCTEFSLLYIVLFLVWLAVWRYTFVCNEWTPNIKEQLRKKMCVQKRRTARYPVVFADMRVFSVHTDKC
jgi:hypothetical protein